MTKTKQSFKALLIIIGFTYTQFTINAQSELYSYNNNTYNSLNSTLNILPVKIKKVDNNVTTKKNYISNSIGIPQKAIVKTGENFKIKSSYLSELLTSGKCIGDLSTKGIFYIKGEGRDYYKVDLNPKSVNYRMLSKKQTLSKNININAWAFNKLDGHLYSVEKNTNHLYRINTTTNKVIDLGEVPVLARLKHIYKDICFDASGLLYVYVEKTGIIYSIEGVKNL